MYCVFHAFASHARFPRRPNGIQNDIVNDVSRYRSVVRENGDVHRLVQGARTNQSRRVQTSRQAEDARRPFRNGRFLQTTVHRLNAEVDPDRSKYCFFFPSNYIIICTHVLFFFYFTSFGGQEEHVTNRAVARTHNSRYMALTRFGLLNVALARHRIKNGNGPVVNLTFQI